MDNKESNIVVSVKNLSKVYKLYQRKQDRMKEALHPFGKKYSETFYALKNVSFTVKKGEILGVVGRNGAGKSTLLEIITGVLSKTSGTVETRGRISALLSLGIGFNPVLTGIENIYLNGTLQGYSKKEIESKIEDILDFAEIGKFAHQPIKTYSSGMKARLGFAVAINIDPGILIVDEALAVGDARFRRKCFAKIENFMNQGKTILIVTHQMNYIIQVCTRAVLMDQGELILEGSPRLVASQYEKLLFSSNEKYEDTRKGILRIQHSPALKEKEETVVNQPENTPADPDSVNTQPADRETGGSDSVRSGSRARFIPNFVPDSTVISKEFDVEIGDLKIKTPEGREVNVLVSGEKYRLSFSARFGFDCENVFFGVRFKTIKGHKVASFTINKEGDLLQRISAGERFSLTYEFDCNLIRKVYLVDCWVSRNVDGEQQILNFISDIGVFKIENNKHIRDKSGIAYLNQRDASIKKMGPSDQK